MLSPTVLTVSQLNSYIKSVIDEDMNLRAMFLCGEISNFTNHYRTGHFYLTLKDDKSSIRAVMFNSSNRRLKFMPENGMKVIVAGRVSVFERDGQYQFYIDDMQPDGIGSLNLAFEQLKKKLGAEGLFDVENKKKIPAFPKKIGVITSPTGAAVRDILTVLKRRYPLAEVVFCGVEVQGENAAPSIVKALKKFDIAKNVDTIILGRGGGSIEDLWAFNEEIVARAIFDCSVPVISGVGHETDFTISDFVADLRAPTPSAAAELAVPDCRELRFKVNEIKRKIKYYTERKISDEKNKLKTLTSSKSFISPADKLENEKQIFDDLSLRMLGSVKLGFDDKKKDFSFLCSRLNSVSPLTVLARGYSIAVKNGEILSSVKNVSAGDKFNLKLSDGEINCQVTGD